MDIFVKQTYNTQYTDLCCKYNRHPVKYDAKTLWTKSLSDYHKSWLANPFVNGNVFFDILYVSRRNFNIIKMFFRRCKPPKNRLEICNKFDFSMSLLSEIKEKMLFYVEDNSKLYAFTITDLLNIINQALTHNIEIHSCPKVVLNPYTRTPFRYETLYLFFLKVHQSDYIMPNLFYQFVKVHFNLNSFLTRNECVLREHANKATVDNFRPVVVYSEIRNMLQDIHVFDVITGANKTILPNAKLLPGFALTHFKSWLYAYYIYVYSLSPTLRDRSYKLLVRSLMLFVKENPDFGQIKNGVVRTVIVSPPKIQTHQP